MERASRQELLNARKSLETSLRQLLDATSKLMEPLKDLNAEQRNAVAILGLIMQSIAMGKRSPVRMSEKVFTQFQGVLDEVCPPLGTAVVSEDPCFDKTVAYLSALSKCEDEGRGEEECFEAWGPGAAAVICAMEEIEAMKTEIGNLLLGQKPPIPIPWPIDHPEQIIRYGKTSTTAIGTWPTPEKPE